MGSEVSIKFIRWSIGLCKSPVAVCVYDYSKGYIDLRELKSCLKWAKVPSE